LGNPDAELSLLLTDDAEIAELNKRYLDRSGPTNVIAFPMTQGDFATITPGLLGDVVISMDTAQSEAEAAGLSLLERFTQLLVHGILHLLGYDHEQSDVEAERMAVKAAEVMAALQTESGQETA
jgi:probable rRNA maturation factor